MRIERSRIGGMWLFIATALMIGGARADTLSKMAIDAARGHIRSNPAQATDLYTRQCAVSVNAKDLAVMAATLADGARNPLAEKQVMHAQKAIADISNALGGNPYAPRPR